MISEREAEERQLGDLPEGIADERDEREGWGGTCPGEVPHADLHGVGKPCDEGPAPIPVYDLLPRGGHPWLISSEGAAVSTFGQSAPWEFDLKNTTGYESIVQRIEWALSPSMSVLQAPDVLLSAFVDGAPAVGLNQLPVGQGAVLDTQLRVPSEGRLVVRVSALALPTERTVFPGLATENVGTARIGEKCFVVCGYDNANGAWVSEVWVSGDWGVSWVQLPDVPWAPAGMVSVVNHGGVLVALVAGAPVGLWASMDNGISWVNWIPDVSVIDALFTAPITPQNLVVVDGVLCAPYWDAASTQYVTFRSQTGATAASWETVVGVVTSVTQATGADAGMCVSYAGRLVMPDSLDSLGYQNLVVSSDHGTTWAVVDTLAAPGTGLGFFVHGRQLWMVNGEWGAPPSWTDDLLNFHAAPIAAWNAGSAGRTAAALFASESRVLCALGQLNGDPGGPLHDVWSGGMVYRVSDAVVHPTVKCSGFYLPPEC